MTKNALAATSLVAALPAGALGYVCVMAFLNYFGDMPMMLQVVSGTTLLMSALLVLAPVFILLFSKGPRTAAAVASAAGAAETGSVATVPARKAEKDETDDLEEASGFEEEAELTEEADDFSALDEDVGAIDDLDLDDDNFEFEEEPK